MIDWSQINPQKFEKLCYKLLELNDFTNIEWYGKNGSDRGRDLVAEKNIDIISNISNSTKWIIQCKRFISRPPNKSEINNFLISAKEHKPNFVLLIVTNTISSDTKDWLKSIETDFSFDINLWEENDLEREIKKHRIKLADSFSFIHKRKGPIDFYEVTPAGRDYFCNELGVGFTLMNSSDKDDDIKRIKDFISFIRENEINFLK